MKQDQNGRKKTNRIHLCTKKRFRSFENINDILWQGCVLDNVNFSISRAKTPKQACKLGFQCNGSFTSFSSLVARCCCLMIFFWTTTDIRKPFKISQRWMLLLAWRPLPFLKGKNPRISLYLLISFSTISIFQLVTVPFHFMNESGKWLSFECFYFSNNRVRKGSKL